jgi:hypothetical protein
MVPAALLRHRRAHRGGRDALPADSIPVTRHRYRGTKIATPWNTEQLQHSRAAFRRVHDERHRLELLEQRLTT